jgi:hypothetical protein
MQLFLTVALLAGSLASLAAMPVALVAKARRRP